MSEPRPATSMTADLPIGCTVDLANGWYPCLNDSNVWRRVEGGRVMFGARSTEEMRSEKYGARSGEPLILIATPVYGTPDTGSVTAAHHMAVSSLLRLSQFTILPAVFGCDLVRGRSRLVRQFLEETTATHLLWWDADVSCPGAQAARLVARMVESGHPFVGCTYARKRLRFDRIDEAFGQLSVPERETVDVGELVAQKGYEYAYSASQPNPCVSGCVEIDALPMGFALCSRGMLQGMVDHYFLSPTPFAASDLVFDDIVDGTSKPTVALFQLMIRDRMLLGEDYSFCARWRDMGGKVQLWAGADCELTHVGAHAYVGRREGYVHA